MKSTKHSYARVLALLVVAGLGALLATASGGCGGADLGECPPGSTAQQAVGRQVVRDNCLYCHASTIQGAARQDAPSDLNFDDLAIVHDNAEDMYGEAEGGDMPPTGALSADKVESMRVWLACGAQDVAIP